MQIPPGKDLKNGILFILLHKFAQDLYVCLVLISLQRSQNASIYLPWTKDPYQCKLVLNLNLLKYQANCLPKQLKRTAHTPTFVRQKRNTSETTRFVVKDNCFIILSLKCNEIYHLALLQKQSKFLI